MIIVDAQVHLRGADTPERPWPFDGLEPVLAAARHPNVAVKASTFPYTPRNPTHPGTFTRISAARSTPTDPRVCSGGQT
jgi:hypothetical protein